MSAAPSTTKATAGETATEWVSLAEATRLLGKHRQQVLALIVRGELTAETRDRYTWVSRDSIERFLAK